MNIKNKFFVFRIFLIILIEILLFVQIQVSAQEENFIDYKTQYNFENVEQLEGQNVQVQQDIETGTLTFEGTTEKSIIRFNGAEYDLSSKGKLKISSLGNIEEGNWKVSEKYIYGTFVLGDNQQLKDIPSKSEISFSKEKKEFYLKFSEEAGDYAGTSFEVSNVDFEKDFEFSFERQGGKFPKEIRFNVDSRNPADMKFLGGEFELPAGSEFSMKNGIVNFPEGTIFKKLPESDQLKSISLGEYVSGKWIQKETLNAQMIFQGKEITISKELLGTNQDAILKEGTLAFNNGKLFIPSEKNAKFNNGIKINSIGTLGESPNTYVYFNDEIAKSSGSENYVVMEDVFKYKRGIGGEAEIDFDENNVWVEMESEDVFKIRSGALGGEGSVEILKGTSNNRPHADISGAVVIVNDGMRHDIFGQGGNLEDIDPKIIVRNLENIYGKQGVNIVLDSSLTTDEIELSDGKRDFLKIRMVCDGDAGSCYYWSNKYDKVGRFPEEVIIKDAKIQEIEKTIFRPDTAPDEIPRVANIWKPNTGEIDAALLSKKEIENFQTQSKKVWESQVKDQFGQEQGKVVISQIDKIYRENEDDFDFAQQLALNYENQLRKQGLLGPQESISSIELSNLPGYNNFVNAEADLEKLAEKWYLDDEWITQEQYNKMIFSGVWGSEEQQQQKSLYYGHRMVHKKINVPWKEVYFFNVR